MCLFILFVVHQEAVTAVRKPSVTQVDLAVMTKPPGFPPRWWMPNMSAVPTPIFLFLHWKMADGKSVANHCSTAWTLPAVIISYEPLGQCQSKLFIIFGAHSCIVLEKNVCIGNSDLKVKPKDVLVKFSPFEAYMIILPQLVIAIDSTHKFIVECHSCWAPDRLPCSILRFPLHHIILVGLCIG